MSRSYQKTPITGCCSVNAGTQKDWKTSEHRKERARVRSAIAQGDYDAITYEDEEHNWCSPQDGKRYWDNTDPETMRK